LQASRVIGYSRRTRRLAAALSAIAGYVDAVGFLSMGGFFISFMSGNSTRLAAGAASGSTQALIAFALIVTFIAGVVVGTRVARRMLRQKATVIALVAALLSAAAAFGSAGQLVPSVFFATLAMGVENAVFVGGGGPPVGLTYMTGTLVRLGQEIAAVTSRRDAFAWWPYAAHWLALVAGATLGALAHGVFGLAALWGAASAAALLAAATSGDVAPPMEAVS
jgi:uncharacterized membrane protein YoaK (UPF0700 family)